LGSKDETYNLEQIQVFVPSLMNELSCGNEPSYRVESNSKMDNICDILPSLNRLLLPNCDVDIGNGWRRMNLTEFKLGVFETTG
jgi:hypothetical protein